MSQQLIPFVCARTTLLLSRTRRLFNTTCAQRNVGGIGFDSPKASEQTETFGVGSPFVSMDSAHNKRMPRNAPQKYEIIKPSVSATNRPNQTQRNYVRQDDRRGHHKYQHHHDNQQQHNQQYFDESNPVKPDTNNINNKFDDVLSAAGADPDKFGTLSSSDPLPIVSESSQGSVTFGSNADWQRAVEPMLSCVEDMTDEEKEQEKKYDKILNHIRLSNDPSRHNSENFYKHKFCTLSAEGKIKEAIEVFFHEMIEKDRFKPTLFLYKSMMKCLADAGYSHMVFYLFKKMTDSQSDNWRELKNHKMLHKVITILFTAAGKSPWPEHTVRKVDSIRFYLRNRNIQPNDLNYAAMIKAYGMAGAIYEAFNVVDEMHQSRIRITTNTLNNLLSSCISDTEHGFKYALLVWQMCLQLKTKPDDYSYGLLLKCANDCQIKFKAFSQKTPQLLPSPSQSQSHFSSLAGANNNEQQQQPQSSMIVENSRTTLVERNRDQFASVESQPESEKGNSNDSSTLTSSWSTGDVIQLTDADVHVVDELQVVGKSLKAQLGEMRWWENAKTGLDQVEMAKELFAATNRTDLREAIERSRYVSLLTKPNKSQLHDALEQLRSEDDTPSGRIALVGGANGVLRSMDASGLKPDYKIFNQLMLLIPGTIEAEEELIENMASLKMKPDIDFINALIRRRLLRKEKQQHIDVVIQLIQANQLKPNIVTFGSMASAVRNLSKLKKFLGELNDMNFKINMKILSTLFSIFHFKLDFEAIHYLFEHIKRDGRLRVDSLFLDNAEKRLKSLNQQIILIEKRNLKTLSKDEIEKYQRMNEYHHKFKEYFEEWSKSVLVQKKTHPYAKFISSTNNSLPKFFKSTEKFQLKTNN